MKPPRFHIVIGRSYLHDTDLLPEWGSKKKASTYSLREARIYLRDWERDGVKVLLVP